MSTNITIRTILAAVSDSIDFDESHYTFSSFPIVIKGKRPFAPLRKGWEDNRDEITIILGQGKTTFKKGHMHNIYCVIPRECVRPELDKYRDTTDPHLFKYKLPEREFNSILNQLPIDLASTIERNRNIYSFNGFEWDGHERWKEKMKTWFGEKY